MSSARLHRTVLLLAWTAPLATFIVLSRISVTDGVHLCSYRTITGQPCVFCGLTRACTLAFQGDWINAFALSPFWLLAVLTVGTAAIDHLAPSYVLPRLRLRIRTLVKKYAWHALITCAAISILRTIV